MIKDESVGAIPDEPARAAIPDEFVLYGHVGANGRFHHIHSHPRSTRMYDERAALWRLTLRRVKPGEPEGQYWGWWDHKRLEFPTHKEGLSMVYPRRGLMEMCFPYGSKAEAEAGRGEVLNLELVGSERAEAVDMADDALGGRGG